MAQIPYLSMDYVLRMIGTGGKKAALLTGYLPNPAILSENPELYLNAENEISEAIKQLFSLGIRSFFFVRLDRLEEVFVDLLADFRRIYKIQTLLITEHDLVWVDSDPVETFDKILWTDDYDIEYDEIVEALVAYCGTVAYYDKEHRPYIGKIIAEARKERKTIFEI